MAFIDNMVLGFTIIILLTNSIVVAFTGLPSNIEATEFYTFGLSTDQQNDLNSSYSGVVDDANNILAASSSFTGSTTEQTSQNILDSILLGLGRVTETVVGGIQGVFSLVTALIKYLFYIVFGYLFWIDYFLNPLLGQGQISNIFINLGLGLKSFFFIIQLIGFTKIIVPIFSGGRRT